MEPKENMKVMKTIDSDGEPCEKKRKKSLVGLRLAEAEEEMPRKKTNLYRVNGGGRGNGGGGGGGGGSGGGGSGGGRGNGGYGGGGGGGRGNGGYGG